MRRTEFKRDFEYRSERISEIIRFFVFAGILASVIVVFVIARTRNHLAVPQPSSEASIAIHTDPTIDLAKKFFDDRDFGAAVATYSAYLADRPPEAAALVERAIANQHRGNLEAATQDYAKAATLADWSEAIQLNLGCVYTLSGDLKKAVTHYSSAVSKNPDSVDGFANLGRCFFQSGDFQLSVNSLSEGIRVTPDDQVLRLNRAISLGKLGYYQPALSDLKLIKRDELRFEAKVLRAIFQLNAGLPRDCLATTQEALKEAPDSILFQSIAANAINFLSETDRDKSDVWIENLNLSLNEFRLNEKQLVHASERCKAIRDTFIGV